MHPALTGRRFYLLHLWLPLLAALPLGWLLLVQGGDLWLADRLFAWEGGRWALRTSPFLQEILHVGGRRLSIASGVLLLIALTVSGLHKSLRSWRRPLLYLITATACAASAIALLKAVIDIDCPGISPATVASARSSACSRHDQRPCPRRAASPPAMPAVVTPGSVSTFSS